MPEPADAEIEAILRDLEDATNAFMRGEMERYLALTEHVECFTLANPFGGIPRRYEDRRPSLLEVASYFQDGEAAIEPVAIHKAEDMLVLVVIERQHGRVGGLPDQPWPLRVTQVYLRCGETWKVVHRHADPLVHAIGLERAAELARG
jgi:hypothetical protein